MTKEIMIECIERAVKNGWCKDFIDNVDNDLEITVECNDKKYWLRADNGYSVKNLGTENDILFNKDFQKALFGGEMVCRNLSNFGFNKIPAWQYHGFELLKADDRGKYLEDYLKSK